MKGQVVVVPDESLWTMSVEESASLHCGVGAEITNEGDGVGEVEGVGTLGGGVSVVELGVGDGVVGLGVGDGVSLLPLFLQTSRYVSLETGRPFNSFVTKSSITEGCEEGMGGRGIGEESWLRLRLALPLHPFSP